MQTEVVLSRGVEKALEWIPRHVAVKLLSWVDAVEVKGLEEVRRIPGYHDEPLKGDREGQRAIRLSRSYRAIYESYVDQKVKVIKVKEVTKHEY